MYGIHFIVHRKWKHGNGKYKTYKQQKGKHENENSKYGNCKMPNTKITIQNVKDKNYLAKCKT